MHNRPHTEAAKAKMSAARLGKPAPWKHRATRLVDGTKHYRCGRCDGFFGAADFYRDARKLDGLKSECRACHSLVSLATRDPENTKLLRRRSEAVRRARKAGDAGAVTANDWDAVIAILGSACLCCGSAEQQTQDHIQPLSKKGRHHPTNLQPLCRPCNERKQARFADYRSPAQKAVIEARWAVTFERTGLDKP